MIVALAACVVVVALAVVEALARVDERRASVVASLTVALLAVAPRVLGVPFQSVAAGTLALTFICSPLAWLGARRMLRSGVLDVRGDVAFVAVFVVVFFLGAWIEIGARLWDGDFGHFGFSSSIARGVLPPEHPLFPGEPLRYHVGFDVLVALLVRAGVAVGAAVHAVSLALLALLLFVARDVGRALAPESRAAPSLTALLALLGYGPAAACLADGWAATAPSLASCGDVFPDAWVSAQAMPPTVFSSFFQHPQGLAMPLSLALVLLACAQPSRSAHAPAASLPRTIVASAGLVLLAHCQIAYFACVGLAIGVAAVVAELRSGTQERARAPLRALLHALPLMLAVLLALITSDIAGGADELRFGRGYFADAPLALIAHDALLFGAPLLALPLAIAVAWRSRSPLMLALAVASLAGFVVASVFTYSRSWDIVKFFAVGAFFANALFACILVRIRSRVVVAVLLALSTWSALFWAVRSGVLNGVVAPFYALPKASPLGADLLRAAGDDIGPRDVILTEDVEVWHQGFHVAGADHRKHAKGQLIDTKRAELRARMARHALRTLDALEIDELSVDWLLVPAKRTIDDATRFERHAEVRDRVLYRVVRR